MTLRLKIIQPHAIIVAANPLRWVGGASRRRATVIGRPMVLQYSVAAPAHLIATRSQMSATKSDRVLRKLAHPPWKMLEMVW